MSNEKDPAILLGNLLRAHKRYLVTAESCTGGLLGHRITNIPGSSDYYLGGFISYANEAKIGWLGVKAATLAKYGAVSRETVLEKAAGARQILCSTHPSESIIAAAISGVAGPGGGTVEKPVGTVWIAVSSLEGSRAACYHFKGNRAAVKAQSADQAITNLIAALSL